MLLLRSWCRVSGVKKGVLNEVPYDGCQYTQNRYREYGESFVPMTLPPI